LGAGSTDDASTAAPRRQPRRVALALLQGEVAVGQHRHGQARRVQPSQGGQRVGERLPVLLVHLQVVGEQPVEVVRAWVGAGLGQQVPHAQPPLPLEGQLTGAPGQVVRVREPHPGLA
jgi:hypothetical protein